MLSEYKEEQSIVYNVLINEINNNNISHAYLFDENKNENSFNIVMSFVKEIITHNSTEDEKNNLCKRIDDGNYPEIKIIEPDGMLIKKQQIIDLQQDFSRAAFEGKKRIYIIKDAEKMRNETANSMLKFLEEPDNDIVAILMTNNFNALLPTIVSRCQLIRLSNNNDAFNVDELDDTAFQFIYTIEIRGINAIMDEQKMIFDVIPSKDRNQFIIFFDKLIDMYYDIMKINVDVKSIKYQNYYDSFIEISDKNSKELLLLKINYLVSIKDNIKNNVNINLLIDSVILKIGGKNEDCWC